MSEPDAYEDEMRRFGRLSDEDIARLLRGEVPEAAPDLEELAAFSRAARARLAVPPPPDVGARHLAAIATAARAGTLASQRPRWTRARGARVAVRLALVAVGAVLGMAGLAIAGVDLPEPAGEVLRRTGIEPREERVPDAERQSGPRGSPRAPARAPASGPSRITPGEGPAGERPEPARPPRADRRDDALGGAPAKVGRSSGERAAERGPRNAQRSREAADPAREGAGPPVTLPPEAKRPGAAAPPQAARPPEAVGPPEGAGSAPSVERPTNVGPPR